ncbi:ribonuclease P protein component [Pseudalkalibacillus caeni]|uniref:Ribonuclease P protein component n=1 Tax=Exobacillus caeni TaxID=2574798 RepID=A0A5R9EYJ2_9BACL|nr:ribonuclease P protein component [Pseudalkalibacillus caeni]TLS35130.1 ribonuclease P protein component [Pseudalkalibacillus caeni]
MNKQYRIKKNSEFQAVFQKGRSAANRQFVLYVLERSDQEHFRLGLSVSKKVGNAVTRNRVKRLVKEAFHQMEEDIKVPFDFVVIARKPAVDLDFEMVKSSLKHVLKRAKIVKGKRSGPKKG